MRAALWRLLLSDGEFRRTSHSLRYYLARQGRRVVLRGGDVTQPIYESRMNWIIDPTPPTSAVNTPPSEAHLKLPRRSRRRRRRKKTAAATANDNSAPCTTDVTAPAEPTANDNSARWPSSKARQSMRSTPVEHPQSFTSSPLSQLPIPAANQNAERASRQDHSEILRLYKPAPTDPRKDLTATQPRVNSLGFGLSSPAPKQPYTKPFSGLPSRPKLTSPYREAGETYGGRPGIVYPLLPRATRPDTRLLIDAAVLPESAALGRQSRLPTVLDIGETVQKENQPPSQSRRQPHKRRRNRSTGIYRPSKSSPSRGRWCD